MKRTIAWTIALVLLLVLVIAPPPAPVTTAEASWDVSSKINKTCQSWQRVNMIAEIQWFTPIQPNNTFRVFTRKLTWKENGVSKSLQWNTDRTYDKDGKWHGLIWFYTTASAVTDVQGHADVYWWDRDNVKVKVTAYCHNA